MNADRGKESHGFDSGGRSMRQNARTTNTRGPERNTKIDELIHKWKRLVVQGQTWAIVSGVENSTLGRTPPIPEREGVITGKIQHTLYLRSRTKDSYIIRKKQTIDSQRLICARKTYRSSIDRSDRAKKSRQRVDVHRVQKR